MIDDNQNIQYPKVFIIILNYDGKDVLKECLNSVFKIDYPNFEVVLVDNNSVDGSLEEARLRFPKCHFIKNENNLGYSMGNNVGIRFALERMADYALLLNNDTIVTNDALLKLVNIGEAEPDLGIMSPLICGESGRIWFSGGSIDWMRMKAVNEQSIPKKGEFFQTDFVSGCAMMVKKKVFQRIGMLDEDFFLYWEDVDFSVRAKRAGFSIGIVPGSKIFHLEKSEQKKESKTYWLVLSGLLFFQKNTSAYLRPWIWLFSKIRMAKNKRDLRRGHGSLAGAVSRAYADFKNHAG